MRNNLKATATGFLAAATLLGGSAFAFAPEFAEDLPTVIVTDRGFETSGFDPEPYVFRYSDAFELIDYIDLKGNQAGDLKYLFNEFDVATPIPTLPNVNGQNDETVLTINGEIAFATPGNEFPEAADFDTAPSVMTGGNSSLTFRNRDFSGDDENVNTGFDNIGEITGWDIDSEPQERVVQLYVKGEPNEDYSTQSFVVITARADGNFQWDELTDPFFTDPVDPFVEETDFDTFGGWVNVNSTNLLGIGGDDTRILQELEPFDDSDITVGHDTDGNGAADAGVESLVLNVAAAPGDPIPSGLAALGIGQISLDANKLYRLRTTWSSVGSVPEEQIRARLGTVSSTGAALVEYLLPGSAADGSTNPAPQLPTTPTEDDLYLLTKGSDSDVAIFYDILALRGNAASIQIDQSTLSSADRDDFVAPSIIFNRGDSNVPALATGEGPAAPSQNVDQFLTSAGTVGESVLSGAVSDDTLDVTFNNGPNALVINFDEQTFGDETGSPPLQQTSPATDGFAAPGFARISFDEGGPEDPDAPGSFTADPSKLYIVDYYVSTNTTNAAPAGFRPVGFRPFLTVGATKNFQHEFDLGGSSQPSAGSAPKVYSSVIGGEEGNVTVGTDFLFILSNFVADTSGQPAQTYTIHRIVANEYDYLP